MRKILITGVTGRVGSQLAHELVTSGHEIRGLAMRNDPFIERITGLGGLQLVHADLRDEEGLRKAVSDVDTVIHLAAQMALDGSPVDLYEVNVMGTMRVLEAVAARDGPPRFLLASTDGTYGVVHPRYTPVDENHPQIPGDYYSGSKVLAERLLENYSAQYGIPYVILRLSTVISAPESLSWFRYENSLARLQRASAGKRTNLWPLFVDHPNMDQILIETVDPTGNPAVALLGPDREPWALPVTDARDTTQAIRRVIEVDAWPNDRFNIAGPTLPSDEGARVIAEAFGLSLYDVELPTGWRYEVTTAKAKARFDYEPVWTFEDTVRDALANPAAAVGEA